MTSFTHGAGTASSFSQRRISVEVSRYFTTHQGRRRINTNDIIGPLSTYIIAAVVAIIIAIVLVGLMLLRKKQ